MPRRENTGLEKAGHENVGYENEGPENAPVVYSRENNT